MTNPVPSHPAVTTAYGIPGGWAAGRHTGQDYAAPAGAPVVAAAAGRVVHAGRGGWGRAYGLHVIIETGAVRHMYAHLSAVAVRVRQQVQAGDLVGKVGATGNVTGPHLHYEERTGGYAYGDDRRPQFPADPAPQEVDVPLTNDDIARIADAVWDRAIKNHAGDEYSAAAFLREASDAPGKTVNYRLTLPDGEQVDLWAVLVDTHTRVKKLGTP